MVSFEYEVNPFTSALSLKTLITIVDRIQSAAERRTPVPLFVNASRHIAYVLQAAQRKVAVRPDVQNDQWGLFDSQATIQSYMVATCALTDQSRAYRQAVKLVQMPKHKALDVEKRHEIVIKLMLCKFDISKAIQQIGTYVTTEAIRHNNELAIASISEQDTGVLCAVLLGSGPSLTWEEVTGTPQNPLWTKQIRPYLYTQPLLRHIIQTGMKNPSNAAIITKEMVLNAYLYLTNASRTGLLDPGVGPGTTPPPIARAVNLLASGAINGQAWTSSAALAFILS